MEYCECAGKCGVKHGLFFHCSNPLTADYTCENEVAEYIKGAKVEGLCQPCFERLARINASRARTKKASKPSQLSLF